MFKTAEEYMTFSQGNLDAFMKSSQIIASGFQDMAKHVAANTQSSMGDVASMFRAMTQLRSVKDAIELQSSLARNTLDKVMSQSGQAAEASYKLAEQAIAPISERLTLAVETFGRA